MMMVKILQEASQERTKKLKVKKKKKTLKNYLMCLTTLEGELKGEFRAEQVVTDSMELYIKQKVILKENVTIVYIITWMLRLSNIYVIIVIQKYTLWGMLKNYNPVFHSGKSKDRF